MVETRQLPLRLTLADRAEFSSFQNEWFSRIHSNSQEFVTPHPNNHRSLSILSALGHLFRRSYP